jgi:hypothetical protein
VLKDALAAEAAHGVFAGGIERVFFAAAAVFDGREAVHIAGGEGDDAAAAVALAHDAGQPRVHGPGERFIACGAEFHARHVDDVRRGGEVGHGVRIEQIPRDGFDAMRVEFLLRARRTEARHGDDASRRAGIIAGAFDHAGK